MPNKRKGTRGVSFFIPDEKYELLENYISNNYTPEERYGARSEVITNAVSCFCSNMNNKASCGMDAGAFTINSINEPIGPIIDRIIKEHKETLDKLTDEEVKNDV